MTTKFTEINNDNNNKQNISQEYFKYHVSVVNDGKAPNLNINFYV